MTTTIMRVSFGGDNGAGRSAGETAQKSTVTAVEVHDVAFGKLLAPGIGSVDIDEDTLQLARAALNILEKKIAAAKAKTSSVQETVEIETEPAAVDNQ